MAATVVVLIVLLAFGATAVRPLIPSPPRNAIATYPGDFLAQAAPERIEWRPIDPAAFADARRLDRPVLLVIGVAWSQIGREFDSEVLTGPDVQNYLSRNFVCVRIDGDEMPAWISAYLPVSRVGLGIRPRFQVWVLTPDGKLISNIGRKLPESHIDRNQFLQEIIRLRLAYTQMREANSTGPLELQQEQDIAQIEAPGTAPLPDFRAVLHSVLGAIDADHGGFPQNGYQDLRPQAWSLLALTGNFRALDRSFVLTLRSPLADLLDGGFYTTARQEDWGSVEFDKSSVQNAETLWAMVLARPFFSGLNQSLFDSFAESTAGSLASEFVTRDGFVAAARIGDEKEDGRSARGSVSPRRLRELFDAHPREVARSGFGLRVETNPQMVPYLHFVWPEYGEEYLRKLREGRPAARFTSGASMNVNGTVAARMMEAGRALGRPTWVEFGSSLFNRLDSVRVDDQVPHDLRVSAQSPATLFDYLAYADAALQDYLSGGRVVSLFSGLAVLQRGLNTFAGPNPGEYRVGLPPSNELIPANSVTPQIVDDSGESATAKVVRLCTAYGRLLLGSKDDSETGIQLLRTAYATSSLFSDPCTALGIAAAGFACSTAQIADDRYAVAVGPQAQQLADRLFGLRPSRLVVAAYGPVRQDLQSKPAGLYVIRRGEPEGPFTVAEAAARLPLTLDILEGAGANRP